MDGFFVVMEGFSVVITTEGFFSVMPESFFVMMLDGIFSVMQDGFLLMLMGGFFLVAMDGMGGYFANRHHSPCATSVRSGSSGMEDCCTKA